jgi:hypothetical protein
MKIETVTIVETCSDPDPLEGDNSPGNKYTRVSINDKHGFRDRNGKMIIEPIYDQAGWFSEGLVTVQLGNHRTGIPGIYAQRVGSFCR